MSELDELSLDVAELKDLLEKATRQRCKESLAIIISKLESDILTKQGVGDGAAAVVRTRPVTSTTNARPQGGYEVKITNYGWDQSDKFVKIYIDLPNVQDLAKSEFTAKSLTVTITTKDNKNHTLTITNLMNRIVADESYAKVKTDKVIVFLRKDNATRWAHLTLIEKKAKETKTPKMEEGADPNTGLMDLMKQMYDDGDDEMKRTIAKAWTESRDKSVLGEQI